MSPATTKYRSHTSRVMKKVIRINAPTRLMMTGKKLASRPNCSAKVWDVSNTCWRNESLDGIGRPGVDDILQRTCISGRRKNLEMFPMASPEPEVRYHHHDCLSGVL